MSGFLVRKVAVLGAGVMGAQIAAQLVNCRVPVVLFDLPAKEGDKNAAVHKALANLQKLKPAPLGVAVDAALIQAANYDDDLDQLKGCDLIIMATSGRKGLQRVLMGSETQYVITHSPIPVLVVPKTHGKA